VLLTVGANGWEDLKETYGLLVNNLKWKVRRSLSHSLHEVAKILGTAKTEQYLLPTFELFLKDLEEVRVGVIRHFAYFLEVLTPPTRSKYLPVLEEIRSDLINWRFRKMLARQLAKLSELFSAGEAGAYLLPLLLDLVQDNVSAVRKAAYPAVVIFLEKFQHNVELYGAFTKRIQPLATDKFFAIRQLFSRICGDVVGHIDSGVYEEIFLPALLTLGRDRIPNVRFAVAEVLSQKLLLNENYKNRPEVLELLAQLKRDPDRDVVYYATLPAGNITNHLQKEVVQQNGLPLSNERD